MPRDRDWEQQSQMLMLRRLESELRKAELEEETARLRLEYIRVEARKIGMREELVVQTKGCAS